jgi:hypothetical protein
MQTDNFKDYQGGLTGPATRHFAIVPDDAADLPTLPRVIYCNAQGAAMIRDAAGVDLSYNLVQGQTFIFRGVRILALGTTASLIGWT